MLKRPADILAMLKAERRLQIKCFTRSLLGCPEPQKDLLCGDAEDDLEVEGDQLWRVKRTAQLICISDIYLSTDKRHSRAIC